MSFNSKSLTKVLHLLCKNYSHFYTQDHIFTGWIYPVQSVVVFSVQKCVTPADYEAEMSKISPVNFPVSHKNVDSIINGDAMSWIRHPIHFIQLRYFNIQQESVSSYTGTDKSSQCPSLILLQQNPSVHFEDQQLNHISSHERSILTIIQLLCVAGRLSRRNLVIFPSALTSSACQMSALLSCALKVV